MNYMPFNSVDHDRVYKAEDWAWYFSTFITNGVFPSPSNGLQVVANKAMTVYVLPGFGFINGYAFRNQSNLEVTIGTADGTLSRIDRIVLRWDLVNRMMSIEVLPGTASREPVAPALTRSADVWELALADVSVAKGVTTITQAMITDDRFNSSLCGICAGVITQIDASVLTKQFNDFFDTYQKTILSDYDKYTQNIESYEQAWKDALNEWEAAQKASMNEWTAQQWQAFNDWLASIKDALGDEAAATLAATATDHEDRLSEIERMCLKNDFYCPITDDDDVPLADDDGMILLGDWKYDYL